LTFELYLQTHLGLRFPVAPPELFLLSIVLALALSGSDHFALDWEELKLVQNVLYPDFPVNAREQAWKLLRTDYENTAQLNTESAASSKNTI
jgi:hypothetical protein